MTRAASKAVKRPSMRFVPINTAEQQANLTVHRTRDLLITSELSL
jgi:transposase